MVLMNDEICKFTDGYLLQEQFEGNSYSHTRKNQFVFQCFLVIFNICVLSYFRPRIKAELLEGRQLMSAGVEQQRNFHQTLLTKLMNFEAELLHLIIQNSPQVDTLRLQAINGNAATLRSFCQALLQLLTQQNKHHLAYEEINKLLISANPEIATTLNNNVLPSVAIRHSRPDLDQYIIFWSKIMQGSSLRAAYPNIKNTLKNAKIKANTKNLAQEFNDFERTFEKNSELFKDEKVEFFDDFDQSSFATSFLNQDNKQQIVQMDMEELKEIRKILEQGPVKPAALAQYLTKAKNFVSINPSSISKQTMAEFKKEHQWAKLFISNYQAQSPNPKVFAVDPIYDEPKINRALPSVSKKQLNNSIHQINIGAVVEEVFFDEEKSKKLMSKRISLAGDEERGNKLSKTNKVMGPKIDNFPKEQRLSMLEPNFIQNPSQLQITNSRFNHLGMEKSRPKIFYGNNSQMSRVSQEYEQPPAEQIRAVKYNNKQYGNELKIQSENNLKEPIQGETVEYINENNSDARMNKVSGKPSIDNFDYTKTPLNNKKNFVNSISPNTAFQNKTMYNTGKKKLSDFKIQKMLRKEALHEEEIIQIQPYLYAPYYQHFNDVNGFCRFRRSCLENNFVLYSSALLLVSGVVERLTDSKIKVQIVFYNKCHSNLCLNTLYRIPKCIKITKLSDISKKWVLTDEYTHKFAMELSQFPLEPCIFNLKYSLQSDFKDLRSQETISNSIPVTIRNFINYLIIGGNEWTSKWVAWTNSANFRKLRNIILDGLVIRQDELESTLRDFTVLNPIEGYSVKQFGGFCSQTNFNNLSFLLRISQRLENIITLEIVASKSKVDENEAQYLEYCLNTWSMLLAKI